MADAMNLVPVDPAREIERIIYDAFGLGSENDAADDVVRRVEAYISALTAREEAPAAPHCQKCGGEVQGWICQKCRAAFRENDDGLLVFDREAPAEWAGYDVCEICEGTYQSIREEIDCPVCCKDSSPLETRLVALLDAAGSGWRDMFSDPIDAVAHSFEESLRNRTSEPEARGAHVAWRSRQRVMRYSGQPGIWNYGESQGLPVDDPVYENQPLYSHPAPATADKLKEGRSLIEEAIKGIQKAPLSVVTDTIWTADPCPMTVVDALQLALAALNEQPQ